MPSYQRTPDRPTYLTSVLRPSAYEIWGKLRESLPPLGYWPVLGWDIFVRPPAQWDYPAPDDTIAEGLGFDLDSWLRDEGGSVTSIAGYYPILWPHCSESPFRYDVVKTDQHVTGDVNQGQTEVPLALVPVDVTWKVPAYLWITGQVPGGAHIALQKRWYERWGAEIVAAQGAHVDLRVLRPPTTPAEAWIVADEMLAYGCEYDYEDARVDSVAVLAPRILHNDVWTLWWT
jgi:hypothetical protein